MTRMKFWHRIAEVMENVSVEDKDQIMEFINHQLDLQKDKEDAQKVKNQTNAELTELIKERIYSSDKPIEISNLMFDDKSSPLHDLSTQKISSLLTPLVNAGIVNRVRDGRYTRFSKP